MLENPAVLAFGLAIGRSGSNSGVSKNGGRDEE